MELKAAARILIADDHRLLAEASKALLEPEFQVIGIVTDGRSLLKIRCRDLLGLWGILWGPSRQNEAKSG